MWVGTYVKELWSCRSFSRVSWVFSEDVSDAKLSKEGYVCKRIAVVSQLQSRCGFFSPSRGSSLSCAPSLRRLADQASSSRWLLRRKNHNIFREYTEEEKSSFELTHFQWKEVRKEGKKDRRISVILHETPETLKS